MPTFPDDVPELTDGRVTLRAHRDSDVPRIVENCRDGETRRWLTLPQPYDEADAREFLAKIRSRWEDDAAHYWAIEFGGVYVGTINLHRRSPASRELGYNLHPDARGKGVMTGATRLVLRHAFDDLGLRTVTWQAARGNWGSRRIAWATGFTVDGTWPDQGIDGPGLPEDRWIGHASARGWTGRPGHPWWEPAVLEGSGLRLRPWRDDDIVYERDELSRSMVTDMQPAPADYSEWLLRRRERMADGEGVFWCIAEKATDKPLGYVQVRHLDIDFTLGNGELGYWLYPHARGRGVMSTAVDLVRQHAFAPRADLAGTHGLGLHRLQAGSDLANTASARVLRRSGFQCWGTERSVIARDDREPSDALNWELLATDDVDAQRVSPNIVPIIDRDGIRLRPWRDDDVSYLPDEVDEVAKRYMPLAAQVTKTSFAGWIARQRGFIDQGYVVSWCVADATTDAPLGNIAIFNIGDRTATSGEVGYWLLPAARGQGVLASALEAVVTHAFSPAEAGGLGLTRLFAETDLDNHASRSLLRGAGFRQWGQDRQAYTAADGRITDGAYFELLVTDARETQRSVLPPVLDFPDVRLRPLRRGDAAAVARTWAEPQVRRWLSIPQDDLEQRAEDHVARNRHVDITAHGSWWVICGSGEGDFAGMIGLQNFADGNAEAGYWLSAGARGQGLATHALDAVCSYAFMPAAKGGLGLRRLRLGVAVGNDASVAVAKRCDFEQIGRARSAELLGDGSVVDLLLFDRLAPGVH
ncbi:GNAT family N-acetyltransferase [Flexivirga endophytica]|nr:GNAT family N-acetyltransferase [Flexivirga endophytica]